MDSKVVPSACLLVENVEVMASFLVQVFGCQSSDISPKPVRHCQMRMSEDTKILLVQKSSCNSTQLSYFATIDVRQIFLSVKDPNMVQKVATDAGAQVSESHSDDQGGSYSIFEGPENVVFHVVSHDRSRRIGIHEMIMAAVTQPGDLDDGKESSKTASARAKQPTAIPIPTLDVAILSNLSRNYVPCPGNARRPIPFETELFKGIALLAVRTKPPDPSFNHYFEGKRRMFEVQVQGRFKRMPIGEIFVGAESANKMELGLITRSISKAVCNFAGTMVQDLHYSFGDPPTQPNYQTPHIVAPLFPTLDKIVATPAGEEPPPLGFPFVEDLEYRKKRLKYRLIADAGVDLETTYSFSVNTQNLDLPNWTLMNIPMVRPMDLRTFFGDSSIRLVAYEIPRTVMQAHPTIHPLQSLNYAFNIRLTAQDPDKVVDIEVDGDGGDPLSDQEDEDAQRGRMSPTDTVDASSHGADADASDGASTPFSPVPRAICETDFVDGDENGPDGEDVGEIDFAAEGDGDDGDDDKPNEDVETQAKASFLGARSPNAPRRGTVGSWFRRRIDDINEGLDLPETPEYVPLDCEMEGSGDLRFCPMAIEVNDHRLMREGRKRTVYLIPWTLPDLTYICRFRAYSEMHKVFQLVPIPKLHKNRKLTMDEKKRRQVVESYKAMLARNLPAQVTQAQTQLMALNDLDKTFLDAAPASSSASTSSSIGRLRAKSLIPGGDKAGSPSERFEGAVAMATSSRSWMEQEMRVTKAEIIVAKHAETRRGATVISTSAIINVRALRASESPLPSSSGFAFFQIETVWKVFYFMVRERSFSDWMHTLAVFLPTGIVKIQSVRQTEPIEVPNIADFPITIDDHSLFLARPVSWKLDKRRVFNYRTIFFNMASASEKLAGTSPLELIEDILVRAFSLSASAPEATATSALPWLAFLDRISLLQAIDLSTLRENERAAFLLNLYHVMVLHGSVVYGPPLSGASWQAFFNTSYVISFELASIAEVEHNMLRAAMSRPSPLISKITAPHSVYPSLALTQRDFRLNFCINNGSVSNLDTIPIYRAEHLDRQMDEVTIQALADDVVLDVTRKIITLPKVCSFFLSDFNLRSSGSGARGIVSSASPTDCLRVLAPYLGGDYKAALTRLLAEGSQPSVRFKPFNFKCKRLLPRRDDVSSVVGRAASPGSSRSPSQPHES